MTISKDTPETLPSGMKNQNSVAGNVGAANVSGLPSSSPDQGAAPQVSELSQEDVNPMQRLTQIIAQSKQTVAQEGMTPLAPPVLPAEPIESSARQTADQTIVQPLVAGDRITSPSYETQPFSSVDEVSQSVERVPNAELVPPPKRGFFSRKTEARNNQSKYDTKSLPRTGREKRVARRRRRLWFEELLGWIFVPVILFGLYWTALGVMALVGTTPEALISGFKLIMSHFW